ncbi:MAG: hypothetical protein MUC85_06445 [Anaerolineales bacterium]|jgi:hypothetical protein|nr:hypothetical protein [Anaerolineales bacterium]
MTDLPPTFHARRHKIMVHSQITPQGQVQPLSFTWRAKNYVISSWGRQWQAADGEHYLVMTESGRMFELVHRVSAGEWFLRGTAPRHATV